MPNGVMFLPNDGDRIVGGGIDATIKVKTGYPALFSTFEMVVPPRFDVGAHLHEVGEEIFFVLDGELEMFAFEPEDRSEPNWRLWKSDASPEGPIRGGAGTFMFIPEGCPHAFCNPTDEPTRIFFQSSVPGGHENYFVELADLLESTGGRPEPAQSEMLRRRWHIQQLTPIGSGAVRT